MQYGTRTLLTRAALTLLALGCATGLGAAKAAAAPRHAAATIHNISACGFVASKPGTYSLTTSVTDSGSGSCITLEANNVTLNLNSHTITGTSTDTCIDVEGGTSSAYVNEVIVGGTKARPTKPATLTNCQDGVNVNSTSGTKASYLTIVAPASFGVFANTARGMVLSSVNVPLHTNDASGFYLERGANNVVTHSTVGNNGAEDSFYAYAETGDTFTYDTAKTTEAHADADGIGFHEYGCSRNTYSHDTSTAQSGGFAFDENGSGSVTATYNTATGSSDIYGSYGFYVNEAYKTPGHTSARTLIGHNKATAFQDDFYDTNPGGSSAVAESWIGNTANNYTLYGFYIYYPVAYTMTGNVADENTSGKKYVGGASYGFYFDDAVAHSPVAKLAKNRSYDNEFGYYSNGKVVHGQRNIAKRNQHKFHNIVNTG